MFWVIIEIEYKAKMVDFLLKYGFEDFYSFDLQQYLGKNLLINDKEKVDGYRECSCFVLFLKKGKKSFKRALKEKFATARFIKK